MIYDKNLFALRTSTNKLPNQNTCSFTQHQLAHQAFNYSVNCIQAAWGAAGELDTEALQRTRLDNPNKQRGRVPSKTHRACTHTLQISCSHDWKKNKIGYNARLPCLPSVTALEVMSHPVTWMTITWEKNEQVNEWKEWLCALLLAE